jgi:hypothetical protein
MNDNDQRQTYKIHDQRQTNIIQLQNTKLLWLYKNKARRVFKQEALRYKNGVSVSALFFKFFPYILVYCQPLHIAE